MTAPGHARLSPQDAARLLRDEGYAYLDVRTPQEFGLGHPMGAYNVPFVRGGEAQFLRVVKAVFAADEKLVVGCHTGNRSQAAAEALLAAGYAVVEQRAGYAGARDPFGRVTERGWQAEGLPSETRAQAGRDYAALAARAGR